MTKGEKSSGTIFEHNPEASYARYGKSLLNGKPGIFKELAERTLWTSPLGLGDRGTRWWPSGISGSDGTADEGIQPFYNSAERGYFKAVASEPNTEARCSSNC
jgi:hypothetical protein